MSLRRCPGCNRSATETVLVIDDPRCARCFFEALPGPTQKTTPNRTHPGGGQDTNQAGEADVQHQQYRPEHRL